MSGCSAYVSITEPLPLCAADTLRVTIAGAQQGLADTPAEENAFDAAVMAARRWLQADPKLSGREIGNRLGTGSSYGRRVKRAAQTPRP